MDVSVTMADQRPPIRLRIHSSENAEQGRAREWGAEWTPTRDSDPTVASVRNTTRVYYMQRYLIAVATMTVLSACGSGEPSPSPSGGGAHVVRCTEPLPEFTLGPQSGPSAQQEAALCACIWRELGGWERNAAQKIAEGKESEVSAVELRAFPTRFGRALEECGGMTL